MDFSSHMAMKKVHINTQKVLKRKLLADVLIKNKENEKITVLS